ncbi:succinyl-diaminopimelate desuccinylase [Buchnera aphidicola]|uniref:Succinyl-diaminopimelate desuccinylase n=1 Tax=Buchnera aphidicola (Sarucallis kahawaluokalani) TaxID=1241878 RepID=A0A4D6YHQ7_9GAMM|nr:succinyl-diaminopimelate desuccinylase [Buchnera aphidicola]QCI25871.1 succinyl-diaminopimelate desuccinylase [Buchnera aphidicola (Sarucallis kahawaluokalani)]
MYCPVVDLSKVLISIPSISPLDLKCQHVICKRLLALGFNVMLFKNKDTNNLWAYRGVGLTFTFAGHTDIVPAGNLVNWNTHPFIPVIDNNILFGRGTSDMKGSLAAMIIAVERFILYRNKSLGRLAFLITSDEESSAEDGTIRIVEYLKSISDGINYCIVGEPTSSNIIGDTIKIGRRGSLHAHISIYGIQGHIAYPQFAENPIHRSILFLKKFVNTIWSSGNIHFYPTSMQISNIYTKNNHENIIPGELHIRCNFRFGTDISVDSIQMKLYNLLNSSNLKYTVKWRLSGKPFVTTSKYLIELVKQSIQSITSTNVSLSTDGGTSDGRFIKDISLELLELGLRNNTIHQVNECVSVHDLQLLSKIYEDILHKIFFKI